MSKRLTRKEIVQEDRIRATLTTVYEWGARNTALLVVAGAAALAGLGGSYWWEYQAALHGEQVQTRFAEALGKYHGQVGDSTPALAAPGVVYNSAYRFQSDQQRLEESLEAFRAVAADYPDQELGELSTCYSALISLELGRREEARQILQRFLEGADRSSARHLSRNLLVRILREDDQPDQVATLLGAILDDPETPFPQDFVILQLAQSHQELGNREEALQYYRRLSTEHPSSWYAETARRQIQQLEGEQSVPEN